MIYKTQEEILENVILSEVNGKIIIKDIELFREKMLENLVDTIILSESEKMKRICYWIAYEVASSQNIVLSSIQKLYEAKAKHNLAEFTVPAINLRTLTFDLARAIFRASEKINAGAFIFEIAKSEIGYTDQRPLEYTSLILLAAIKENFRGPVFVQGDHFQVKAQKYLENKEEETKKLKDLIREVIEAGFYNIDIDSSTLVDISKETILEQQKLNYELCAEFTKFIRQLQPKGVDVLVGGEIGEIGTQNSTPEELHAFMAGYNNEIGNITGIAKMSVQTGTSHGGVVLPDGSIAKVDIDFDTLRILSKISREEYGMAGAVQHGASTLPREAFHHFPKIGCCEIHLATGFQNLVYDNMPEELREEIYEWIKKNLSDEKKPNMTEEQFIYKTRKKALGPFKKKIHSLDKKIREKIFNILESEFSFLFDQLSIKNTLEIVDRFINPVKIEKSKKDFLKDAKDLGELEGAD